MTRKPRILGAILAGGQSRRFGSDKAGALLDGAALLDHVAAALRPQCDRLVVVGRDWPGLIGLADLPAASLGPLGGLAGALAYAAAEGFEAVLTAGCDMPGLPLDLASRLAPASAVAEHQPLLGLWDAALAEPLRAHLHTATDRSIRAWIALARARTVTLPILPRNINRPEDLAGRPPS